jgi:hypothetical protein
VEAHNLQPSQNTIRVIKSRKVRREGHSALGGDEKFGKPEETRPLGIGRFIRFDNIEINPKEL